MKNLRAIQERYLRDPVAIQLGGLAANLARVKSFADHPEHQDVIETLLEESKFFIEWTVPETDLKYQAVLVQLQLELARWQLKWADIWTDPGKLTAVANLASDWSKRVLGMSGLLP